MSNLTKNQPSETELELKANSTAEMPKHLQAEAEATQVGGKRVHGVVMD